MIVSGIKLKNKYLLKPKKKIVTYLSDWQIGISEFDEKLGKRITVIHYHEPYIWDFYIQFIDEKKGNKINNRIIWYGYNFEKKKKIKND